MGFYGTESKLWLNARIVSEISLPFTSFCHWCFNWLIQRIISWSWFNFCFMIDDTNFELKPYSELKHPDKQISHVSREGYCRTYCAGNSSCAAYSYNSDSSTCRQSSEPDVTTTACGGEARQAYVKVSFAKTSGYSAMKCIESSTTYRADTTATYSEPINLQWSQILRFTRVELWTILVSMVGIIFPFVVGW